MNPRTVKNFDAELFVFIKKEEGCKPTVYPCSEGVPTIGVGYALAEKGGGGFSVRGGLDADLAAIDKVFTEEDKKRLNKLCTMLNDGTIKQAKVGNEYIDRFDLTITDEQAKKLFRTCMPQYDAVLRRKLGINLYRQLQNSKEMIALFSLAYNAPSLIGKNLVAALKEGNRAKVRYEILYNSNKDRSLVLDNRRKDEAPEFGRYDGDAPTVAELQAENEVNALHGVQLAAYDSDIAGKRNRKSAKRASGPRTAHNNRKKQPSPGTVPNQQEVRKRIDQVKAHLHNDGLMLLDRLKYFFEEGEKAFDRNWNHHPAGFDDRHYHKRWS